jgi:hypothetical protein
MKQAPIIAQGAVPGTAPSPVAGAERDLRLDLFRGLALWLIFLDHIPSNIVNWVTLRNYGFSDATEIFVFISGYTAAFVYGRAMQERGFVVATARVLKRVWQIYVAHIFLFTIYLAEISYVAQRFDNPLYGEEMGILDFLKEPDVTILQALLLKFKPVNMDVLPLYIVLLGLFPPMLWLLLRNASLALLVSGAAYAWMWWSGWNFPAYPDGTWAFNPIAWQFLFVLGAWCALGGAQRLARWVASPVVVGLAIIYLLASFAVVMTWYFPRFAFIIPRLASEFIYPIDKTSLDVLRILHFLALAVVTVKLVPFGWPGLKARIFRPLIKCGQHSLEIFCFGVFLSFAAHFVLTEISGRILSQILCSAAGVLLMIAVAYLLTWYKEVERRAPGSRPSPAQADLAGGGGA